jgi:hypothetical protein
MAVLAHTAPAFVLNQVMTRQGSGM